MKKNFFFILAPIVLLFACNSNSTKNVADHQPATSDTEMHASTDEAKINTTTPTYKDLSKDASVFLKSMVDNYLDIESALVKGDDKSASQFAQDMSKEMKGFDKSQLTIDQKKAYNKIESDLRNATENIASSSLDQQRKQFVTMSNSMYALAKDFPTGYTLYHQFCPMYEGGSYWLSKAKNIENPFYGDKMLTCGSVKEIIE